MGVAGAFEACAGGVPSGSVSAEWKASMLSWLQGSGSAFFDASLRSELAAWCTAGDASFVLSGLAIGSLDMAFLLNASVMEAGGWVAYFNG